MQCGAVGSFNEVAMYVAALDLDHCKNGGSQEHFRLKLLGLSLTWLHGPLDAFLFLLLLDRIILQCATGLVRAGNSKVQ